MLILNYLYHQSGVLAPVPFPDPASRISPSPSPPAPLVFFELELELNQDPNLLPFPFLDPVSAANPVRSASSFCLLASFASFTASFARFLSLEFEKNVASPTQSESPPTGEPCWSSILSAINASCLASDWTFSQLGHSCRLPLTSTEEMEG